jgi:hypothetical protein
MFLRGRSAVVCSDTWITRLLLRAVMFAGFAGDALLLALRQPDVVILIPLIWGPLDQIRSLNKPFLVLIVAIPAFLNAS